MWRRFGGSGDAKSSILFVTFQFDHEQIIRKIMSHIELQTRSGTVSYFDGYGIETNAILACIGQNRPPYQEKVDYNDAKHSYLNRTDTVSVFILQNKELKIEIRT